MLSTDRSTDLATECLIFVFFVIVVAFVCGGLGDSTALGLAPAPS